MLDQILLLTDIPRGLLRTALSNVEIIFPGLQKYDGIPCVCAFTGPIPHDVLEFLERNSSKGNIAIFCYRQHWAKIDPVIAVRLELLLPISILEESPINFCMVRMVREYVSAILSMERKIAV